MGALAQLVSLGLGQQILETLSYLHSAIMSKLLLLAVALAVVMVTEVYSIPDCAQIGMEPTWHQFPSGKQCTCSLTMNVILWTGSQVSAGLLLTTDVPAVLISPVVVLMAK